MILYLMLIAFFVSFFFLGFYFGKKKNTNISCEKKVYNIYFIKQASNETIIKSSFVVREIMNFCDSMGIDMIEIKMEDYLESTLKVKATKDQYFLLVQELSDPKYRIELCNLTF